VRVEFTLLHVEITLCVLKLHSACINHTRACRNHTRLYQNYTFVCGNHNLRVKTPYADGNCTLRVEITLVRVVIADFFFSFIGGVITLLHPLHPCHLVTK
jgi:hypothetical protein